MKDLREFANVLDWILLMDYDVWGCKLSILSNSTDALTVNLMKHLQGLAQTLPCMTPATIPRNLVQAQLQGLMPGLQRTSQRARSCLDYLLMAISLPPRQSTFGQDRSPLGFNVNQVPSQ
jgi:hypothetical protein